MPCQPRELPAPTVDEHRTRAAKRHAWLRAGLEELPAVLGRRTLRLRLTPLESPGDGLFVTIEVFQDGRQLGGIRLKGLGALREIPLCVRLDGGRSGRIGLVRVRSNAKLRITL